MAGDIWTCEVQGRLLGCGIDAEAVGRFRRDLGGQDDPWEAIFTEREIAHARSLADPAFGLCASFCCKEAVIKALGTSLDYRECELLFSLKGPEQHLELAPALCLEREIRGWSARVEVSGAPGQEECVASVCLFGT